MWGSEKHAQIKILGDKLYIGLSSNQSKLTRNSSETLTSRKKEQYYATKFVSNHVNEKPWTPLMHLISCLASQQQVTRGT
jgi:hypothetical protein